MPENDEGLNHIIAALLIIMMFLVGLLFMRENKKTEIKIINAGEMESNETNSR